MKITIEPTEEIYEFPIEGKPRCRIWKGTTDRGTAIEVYIFSIVPANEGESIEDEMRAAGVIPSREVFDLKVRGR